ncbi:MAG: hypothetical protein KGZ54_00300 [Dethiobacter sp.]|jgi:hypothetical protein|nr:hypothetical protein [Dethiobacter sp.]
MNVHLVIGEFRSRDTAQRAIEELGRHGFLKTSIYQIGNTPVEGIDTMKNSYAGELPLFGRGVKGSDVAIEGRTNEKTCYTAKRMPEKSWAARLTNQVLTRWLST